VGPNDVWSDVSNATGHSRNINLGINVDILKSEILDEEYQESCRRFDHLAHCRLEFLNKSPLFQEKLGGFQYHDRYDLPGFAEMPIVGQKLRNAQSSTLRPMG